MTFVLHQLSHYNSITEPRARFLLSFLERLTIDFFSHFILSLIDVYRDTATYDKLIFPLAITWILRHFSDGARPSFNRGGLGPRRRLLQLLPLYPPPLLRLLRVV